MPIAAAILLLAGCSQQRPHSTTSPTRVGAVSANSGGGTVAGPYVGAAARVTP